MSELFQNIQVKNPQTQKNITVKFLNGWRLTISSFLSLFNDLKSQNINYIFTRRLNQDCLENFFGKIRQHNGNCRNPTPIQFVRTFKKMFSLQYFDVSEGSNCVEEFDQILTRLTPEKIKSFEIVCNSKTDFDKIILTGSDYRYLDFQQKNSFYYVGGYFIKKCFEKHTCKTCGLYARGNKTLSEESIYMHLRAYQNLENDAFGNLKSPETSFFQFLGACEKVFVENFKNLCILPNVGIRLREIILNIPFAHPCTSFPKQYFASLFVRTRIFYTLKFLNRDVLKAAKSGKKCQKLLILKHL